MDRDAIYLPLRGLYYMYIILKNTYSTRQPHVGMYGECFL